MKPAAYTREVTEMHVRNRDSIWESFRSKAVALAYEPAPHGTHTILWIADKAIEEASKDRKYHVRLGKLIDFKKVDPNVVNEVISTLEEYRYTVVKSFKSNKLVGLLVSWAE